MPGGMLRFDAIIGVAIIGVAIIGCARMVKV